MKKSKIPLEPLESRDETNEQNNNSEYRKYQCKICKKKFSSIKKLKNHIKHKHGDQTPENDITTPELDDQTHFESDYDVNTRPELEDEKLFQCMMCNESFPDFFSIESHINKEHENNNSDVLENEEMLKCVVCSAEFEDQDILKTHVDSVHGGKTWPECKICDANFNNYRDLEEHIEVVHDGKSLLECKTCDANFTNYGDLDEHVEFRHGGNTLPEWVTMLKCQVCSAEYEDQKTLKTHVESMHGGKTLPECKICEANFKTYGDLEEHVEFVHDGKSLLKCKKCDADFANYGDLEEHVESKHGGNTLPEQEKMLSCQVCSQVFRDQKILKTHFENVHDVKTVPASKICNPENHNGKMLQCQLCNAKFEDQNILRMHFESFHDVNILPSSEIIDSENHNGKMFQCQLCDKEFEDQKILEMHFESVHDVNTLPSSTIDSENHNEKMLKCQLCDDTFEDQKILEKHFHSVHDVKNRDICDLKNNDDQDNNFINEALIDISQESYSSSTCELNTSRKFKCNQCNELFLFQSNLETHCILKHPEESFDAEAFANILEDEPNTAFDEIETIFDKSPSTPYMPNQSCINSKHTESDEFKCSECNQTFLSESDLMAHLESKHKLNPEAEDDHVHEIPLKCNICYYKCSTTQGMKKHCELLHENKNTFDNKEPEKVENDQSNEQNNNSDDQDLKEAVHEGNKTSSEIENEEMENDQTSEQKKDVNPESTSKSSKKRRSVKIFKRRLTAQGKGVKEVRTSPNKSPNKAKIENIFRCPICSELFNEGNIMADHMISQHVLHDPKKDEEEELPPSPLFDIFLNESNQDHPFPPPPLIDLFLNESNQDLPCPPTPSSENFKCDICNCCLENKENLKKHMASIHENIQDIPDVIEKPYQCPICDELFSESQEMSNHMMSEHEDVLHGSNESDQQKKQSHKCSSDDQNRSSKDGKKPFICTICDTSFIQDYSLFQHNESVHAGRNFCSLCDSAFSTVSAYLQHVESVHDGGKQLEYKCNICHNSYNSESSWKQHVESAHERKEPFKCDVCNDEFLLKSGLSQHVISVHERAKPDEKPFTCQICKKGYTTKPSLKRHTDSAHKGKKPFKCSRCDANFTQKSGLRKHLKAVHDEKSPISGFDDPLESVNDKEIPPKEELSVSEHSKSDHEDQKPFTCTVCQKGFTRKLSLKTHIETIHEGKKPFECPICEVTFSQKSGMNKHINSVHDKKKPDISEPNTQIEKNYSIIKGRTGSTNWYRLDNFLYVKNDDSSKTIFLNCNERKNKNSDCPGTATIDIATNQMSMINPHNHESRQEKIEINELRHSILDGAGEISDNTLLKTFAAKTSKQPLRHKVLYTSLESGMRKRRAENFPNLPKSIEEVHSLMQNAGEELNKHYQGTLKVKGKAVGIVMYDKELFQIMNDMTELGYDGTYFVVPEPCHQLWTIHFIHRGHFFPGCSILFTGATTEMYQSAWEYLDEKLPNFTPLRAHGDFEKAPAKAAKKTFKDIIITHCMFHFAQAIFRNMQKHGLAKQYDENLEFITWLKNLMAVPMLRSDIIPTAFKSLLKENIPMPSPADRLNFLRFKRYVQKQWTGKHGVKPENLSVFRCEHKTTNGCESFHAKLKSWIDRHRPNFWIFMLNFNRVLDLYLDQYHRTFEFGPEKLTRKKKVTEKNKTRRETAEDLLESKDPKKKITWQQFLGIVSYTQNSLAERLQKQFRSNNDELLDDHEIYFDPNDNGEEACIKCHLHLFDKVAITCGHTDVCKSCVDDLKNSEEPNCPTCGDEITSTISLKG